MLSSTSPEHTQSSVETSIFHSLGNMHMEYPVRADTSEAGTADMPQCSRYMTRDFEAIYFFLSEPPLFFLVPRTFLARLRRVSIRSKSTSARHVLLALFPELARGVLDLGLDTFL